MRLGLFNAIGGPNGLRWLTRYSENLAGNPPSFSFFTARSGTWTWDFHSLPTPPAKGAGNIATGSGSVIIGTNNKTIDLSANPGVTGYLYHRITDANGKVSNVIRSAQFTTASGALVNEAGSTGWTFSDITVATVNYRLATATTAAPTLVVTGNLSYEAELIAAGASGGRNRAGGGGAGRRKLISGTLTAGSYVGARGVGGAARTTDGVGNVGGDTSFNGTTAKGGGGGGWRNGVTPVPGDIGGHGGGGGGGTNTGGDSSGGASNDSGNAGGAAFRSTVSTNIGAGGGGGEGGVGGAASNALGGVSGAPVTSDFDGTSTQVCGGGRGHSDVMPSPTTGAGGPGWGGDGSSGTNSGAGSDGRLMVRWPR